MAGKQLGANLMLVTMVFAAFFGFSSAVTHIVGGNTGWTVPSSPSFYSNWASRQTFRVGDVLVFRFPPNAHTVADVNRANFDGCNTANTLSPVRTTAPANYTLSAGTHYYICTIPGHCSANQKLSVTVSANSSSSPSPSPSGGSASQPSPAANPPSGATAPGAPSSGGGAGSSPSGAGAPAGGAGSPPPAGNFAAPATAGVGLLSLVSVVVVALMF